MQEDISAIRLSSRSGRNSTAARPSCSCIPGTPPGSHRSRLWLASQARSLTSHSKPTEPIDKTEYGDYTAIKQQLRHFLDEVYMLQQHPFYLGLAHSSRV